MWFDYYDWKSLMALDRWSCNSAFYCPSRSKKIKNKRKNKRR